MPARDPTRPQLDFPQLVADIIEQLQLTGTVGLLDFAPSVQPVYIAAQREGALSIDTSGPAFDSAELFAQQAVNPATPRILADTGQLVAGTYDFFAEMGQVGSNTAITMMQVEHRDAANAATLAVLAELPVNTALLTNHILTPLLAINVGTNERLRVTLPGGGPYTGLISSVIGAKRRVEP